MTEQGRARATGEDFRQFVFDRVAPEPNTGCWIWMGAANDRGYPRINREGKNRIGTRLMWERVIGRIPAKMCVLHKCDVPSCINPDHLFLGTLRDNSRDMMLKERSASPLTASNVREMRRRRKLGETYPSIARDYGIHPYAARNVILGKRWGHVS